MGAGAELHLRVFFPFQASFHQMSPASVCREKLMITGKRDKQKIHQNELITCLETGTGQQLAQALEIKYKLKVFPSSPFSSSPLCALFN